MASPFQGESDRIEERSVNLGQVAQALFAGEGGARMAAAIRCALSDGAEVQRVGVAPDVEAAAEKVLGRAVEVMGRRLHGRP